jgi:endonuclease/exonuclease/phosphatase family metal-dependent hydrolase
MIGLIRAVTIALVIALRSAAPIVAAAENGSIRVATYNTSLFRDHDRELVHDLEGGANEQARKIAEVIQRVRPDIMLVNEFDYDAEGRAAQAFVKKYLAVGQNGCEPIEYPFYFCAPVNTGMPSGRDLSKDGRAGEPADAIGFGRHEGQYGLLVLSKYAIDRSQVRTFQKFLWRDMPGAMLPNDPRTGQPFYDREDLAVLRLSSKSHIDVPIQVPNIVDARPFVLHLLASHPTPPVFDGPEDRNGRRNHDEVRMLADYIDPARCAYLTDDAGKKGGLPAEALFVILGDLNSDPVDGDSVPQTMNQLLHHRRVNESFTPTSKGGASAVARHPDQHLDHRGKPENVTADFTGEEHGCLRIDYVLPSKGLEIVGGGVFWPAHGEPGSEAITATDHRLVWLDLRPE